MVRMKARLFAVLGVLFAIAMTPRTALAESFDKFPYPPAVVYNVGSAPTLLDPDFLFDQSSPAIHSCFNGSLTMGYNVKTSTTSTMDYYRDIQRNFDTVVYFQEGEGNSSGFPSGATVYVDFYFYGDSMRTFSTSNCYQVCWPNTVCTALFKRGADWYEYMYSGYCPFTLDNARYYWVDDEGNTAWRDVSPNLRYPHYGYLPDDVAGCECFVIRGHFTILNYGAQFQPYHVVFGADGLTVRLVYPDSFVVDSVNGDSGKPLADTVSDETQAQTDTLMDTTGSDSVLSDLSGGGVDGLTNRLGFISQVIDISGSFFETLRTSARKPSLHFPGVVVQGITLIPEQDVSFNQGGLGSVIDGYIRPFVTGLLCVVWVFGMKHVFELQILGYSNDSLDAEG